MWLLCIYTIIFNTYPRAINRLIVIHIIESLIHGIRLAQRLVDTPPNILHTTQYTNEVVLYTIL